MRKQAKGILITILKFKYFLISKRNFWHPSPKKISKPKEKGQKVAWLNKKVKELTFCIYYENLEKSFDVEGGRNVIPGSWK